MSIENIRQQIVAEFVALGSDRDVVRGGVIGDPQGTGARVLLAVGIVLAHIIDERLAAFAADVQAINDEGGEEDALP